MFDQDLLGQAGAQGNAGAANPANKVGSPAYFSDQGVFAETHLAESLTSGRSAIQTPDPHLIP